MCSFQETYTSDFYVQEFVNNGPYHTVQANLPRWKVADKIEKYATAEIP
jgi:hypothetical protein